MKILQGPYDRHYAPCEKTRNENSCKSVGYEEKNEQAMQISHNECLVDTTNKNQSANQSRVYIKNHLVAENILWAFPKTMKLLTVSLFL